MKKRFKIAHITAQKNIAIGGIRTQLKTLLYCMGNEKNENIILTNESEQKDRQEFRELGVTVYSRLNNLQLEPSNPLAIIQWMTQMLKQLQPDFAITYSHEGNILGTQAAFSAGIRPIFSRKSNTILELNEKQIRINRHLAKITDCIICNAEAVRKYAREVEQISHDRLEVIHNGIILENYQFKSDRFLENPYEFVYIGRLERQKNPLLTIDAFSALVVDLPELHLSIIGDGSLKEECLERVNKLGLSKSVSFLGYRQKPWDWVKPGSFLILTSFYEGLPNTVLEAMASGIIAIVPNLPVMNEIVKNGLELIIYDTGDRDKLIEAMKFALQITPEKKLSRIKAARATVERDFDGDKMTAKYLELFQEIYCKKTLNNA